MATAKQERGTIAMRLAELYDALVQSGATTVEASDAAERSPRLRRGCRRASASAAGSSAPRGDMRGVPCPV
jgi:hypothetical protein